MDPESGTSSSSSLSVHFLLKSRAKAIRMRFKYFHSLMPRSPWWYTGGWLVNEINSFVVRTVNNNEGGDDFNWNSLLNSDSFRSFQQHGMSQLPNLTNAEMSFHPGAISASSTMSQTRLIDSRSLSLTQLFSIALLQSNIRVK